jgi:GntR family transcriptional regulator, sialic acid-inducible nan operon repressor
MLERQPIQRRKLSEEVTRRLEEMILSGRLPIGAYLPSERELMETFGVGRPSIREAIFALQRMGLVATAPGGRPMVARPSPEALIDELGGAARYLLSHEDGIRQFQGARRLFEAAVAREAARVATDEQIEELREALRFNQRAVADLELERSDVLFHLAVARIPGNPIYTAIHEAMMSWLTEQRRMSMRVPGAIELAKQAHGRVFEAIAARDPDAAERAMADHLGEVATFYWTAAQGKTGDG